MAKWVYSFGNGTAEGRAEMRDLLGGKGANLAEMSSLGLPVPPGFTVTTELCTYYYANKETYPSELKDEVEKALAAVEKTVGAGFGDANNPLLVSVRSGARASMPGMMDTVLNLGLNDRTVLGLSKSSGDERFAWDSYRRFIQMYSNVVLDVGHHYFEEALELRKEDLGVHMDTDLKADDWRAVVAEYKKIVEKRTGKPLPAGAARAAVGRDRRGVRLVDEPARHHLSPAARDSRELGHRGQRAGDGVRQHGRRLRHRRRLHARPFDRHQSLLRRISGERPGRGCRGRHPHAAASHGRRQERAEVGRSRRWKK